MFPLLETVLELTFRDGLEYARGIIFNCRCVIESLSFEWFFEFWIQPKVTGGYVNQGAPKILFKIYQRVVFGISRSFSSSQTVNQRSLSIASRTRSIFFNVFVVEGRPERESLSTEVRPPLKRLYHFFIRVLLIHSFPKAFCII